MSPTQNPQRLHRISPVFFNPTRRVYPPLPYSSGVAFPAAPATGTLFFRTDLGWLCYYDGTRWQTINNFQSFTSRTAMTVTISWGETRTRSDYAPYFTHCSAVTLNAATVDVNNYWTVNVRSADLIAGTNTVIYSFDTHLDTAGAYTNHSGTPTTPNPTRYGFMQYNCVPTGSPGALALYIDTFFRLIVP